MLLGFLNSLAAQNKYNVDSLVNISQNTSNNSLDRLNTLDFLCWDVYLYYKPDSAYYFAEKMAEIAKAENKLSNWTNALTVQGVAMKIIGNYSRALQKLDEALLIFQEMEKSTDSLTHLRGIAGQGSTRGNMGNIYRSMGDHEQALKCYRFNIETTERIKVMLGAKSGKRQTLSIANSFINMGATYIYQRKWDLATEANTKALELFISINDRDAQASCYRNLGIIAEYQFRYKDALSYFEKCMDIRRIEADPTELASIYNSLAGVHYNIGDYKQSLSWNQKSLAIAKEINGSVAIRDAMEGLYHAYRALQNLDSSGFFLQEAIRINDQLLELNFPILSEKEKEKLFEMVLPEYASLYSFAYEYKNIKPEITGEVYTTVIRNKGMLLRSSTSLLRLVQESGDSVLLRLYQEWIEERKILAEGFNGIATVEEIEEKANAIEKEMVKRSSSIGLLQSQKNSSWKEVQNALKKDEAAIEFIRYLDKYRDRTTLQYAALVVRPGMKQPELILLCTEKELEALIGKRFSSSLDMTNHFYGRKNQLKSDLYQLIWKPLENLLKGSKTVYFSPDGLLHKISFSAFYTDKKHYLSEKIHLRQVSNTAVLAINKTSKIELNQVQLYGGLDYTSSESPNVWNYLPGTLQETQQIETLLKNKKISVEHYSGSLADEQKFRERVTNSKILHLSTHGFFFPDPVTEDQRSEQTAEISDDMQFRGIVSEGRNRLVINPNPLMRSGLVVAGANRIWKTNEIIDADLDGVLTAMEIATLDLNKTQLVVLSACETGLGDIRGSEGVFGLQRSLKMAGARFIIMSLWQVPDQETAEFMILFYQFLLQKNDVRIAFESAQKIMRSKYDPFFWAAFILVE